MPAVLYEPEGSNHDAYRDGGSPCFLKNERTIFRPQGCFEALVRNPRVAWRVS